jgi:hypothetical protein
MCISQYCSRSQGTRLSLVNGIREISKERVTLVACSNIKVCAQRVVYGLFVLTLCRHNVIELCAACQSSVVGLQRHRFLSPSQNCCSFSRSYDTSNAILCSRTSHQNHCPRQRRLWELSYEAQSSWWCLVVRIRDSEGRPR